MTTISKYLNRMVLRDIWGRLSVLEIKYRRKELKWGEGDVIEVRVISKQTYGLKVVIEVRGVLWSSSEKRFYFIDPYSRKAHTR